MDALDALYVLNYGHEVTADITSKYPLVTWFHLLNETSYFEHSYHAEGSSIIAASRMGG